MTQRRPTEAEIVKNLEVIMQNRRDRIVGLTNLLKTGNNSPKDVKDIQKEIREHERWIEDAEKTIKRFYQPITA